MNFLQYCGRSLVHYIIGNAVTTQNKNKNKKMEGTPRKLKHYKTSSNEVHNCIQNKHLTYSASLSK